MKDKNGKKKNEKNERKEGTRMYTVNACLCIYTFGTSFSCCKGPGKGLALTSIVNMETITVRGQC